MSIKALPDSERPRERLIENKNISLVEILAILISTGYKEKSALDLARIIISRFGFYSLKYLNYNDLIKIRGINKAKASRILAAIKLAKIINKEFSKPLIIRSPSNVFKFINKLNPINEKIFLFSVDNRNRLLVYEAFPNNNNIIRQILGFVIKNDVFNLIIAHNHTSGICRPSKQDIRFTKRIKGLLWDMNTVLVDHIIVTKKRYFSFRLNKML